MKTSNIPDPVKHKLGTKIAEIMLLKRDTEYKDRYVLGGDHHTKTAIGIFETVHSIVTEEVKKEKNKTTEEIITEYKEAFKAANGRDIVDMYYAGHGWFMLKSDPTQPAHRLRTSVIIKAINGLKSRANK